MKNIALFAGIFLLSLHTNAQQFRYLRPQEGLFDGEINSIVQDQTGNMWLATWSGLIRYDGISFTSFRPEIGNPKSLPDKKIKKLFVDSYDNLWIITSRGLNRYNQENHSFETIAFDRQLDYAIDINYLSEVDGNLIVHALEGFFILPLGSKGNSGYQARKLDVYDGQEVVRFLNHSVSYNNVLYLVAYNRSGGSDLCRAKLDTSSTGQPVIQISEKTGFADRIHSMEYVEPEKTLYLATDNGITGYVPGDNTKMRETYFKGIDVRNLLYASDHKLYGSTNTPELLYIDLHLGKTGSFKANPNRMGSLLNNNIHCLFEDFSGNLWIGHQGQGISIKNLYLKEFYTFRSDPNYKNTLRSNIVMCFNGNSEEILIGCRTGGINIMKKNMDFSGEPEFKVVEFQQFDANRIGIWTIARESEFVFWVGTDYGLMKLVKKKGEWQFDFSEPPIYRGAVRNIFIDEHKNIWCGTWRSGLLFIPAIKNNPERKYYHYRMNPNDQESLTDNFIQAITLDSKGRFWVGTVNGLNVLKTNYRNLDLSGNSEPQLRFKRYIADKLHEGYLNNNEINCIFENYDGKIWLATQGGGINILDPGKETFTYLTTEEGLPSNDVMGIMMDHMGRLWISTNRGLASYIQFTEKAEVKTYGINDGIQGEIFMVNAYYKSWDGEMFFGGDNGFTRFYPSRIKANPTKPKIALTNLRLGNEVIQVGDTVDHSVILKKSLHWTDRIELAYKHNTFSIGVSSLHFQHPEGNRIQYMLEDYDETWRSAIPQQQYVYYSNLPFGEYTFKAKAVSSDDIESENIKEFDLEILPPWYLTWYMSILFFVGVLLLMSGFIYVIVNRQRLIFERKINKIKMENNESKMAFLTNIAHELRTPLSLVTAPVDDMIQNYKNIDPFWKNHLNLIYRNSRYLLKLINQIIDFRKLHAGKLNLFKKDTDVVRLVKDVVLNFKYMESQRKVNLNINVPPNKIVASVDGQKIEEILYNLLSNAFKHTEDNHDIMVTLALQDKSSGNGHASDEKQLLITVFNEGPEIDEEEKSKIFARFYKTNDHSEGAGIGLSFTKSLVEMHDGTIEVSSIPGKGVAFHVLLPFTNHSEETLPLDLLELGKEMIRTEHEPLLKHFVPDDEKNKECKILIVEDNEDLRNYLKNVLSRIYTCYMAKDGQEGWNIIREILPDVVISDIIMPVKDGLQLCKQIKENLKTCHIPVILLTAKNDDNQIISGYNLGADAYVTKPFDINLILSQVARLIKNRELIREKYITQNFMVEVTKTNLSKDDEFIMSVRSMLEENIADADFNVKELSARLHISTTQLYRKLKALTGYSPVEFIRVVKLQKAYNLLNKRSNTVKEVCYLSGFNNLSYFIKCFREHFGVTPANYRDKGFPDQVPVDDINITSMP
jgi:signal transduction histidine kinase/ligand-binding sensor domain-containing protein/AraC-like DNA-binding protein